MANLQKARHERLARRPGIWRVDGLGVVRDRGAFGVTVQVLFSGILESSIAEPWDPNSETGECISLYIHVAGLRLFHPGTLWKNGQRIQAPPLPHGCQAHFTVASGDTKTVSLSYRHKIREHWISSILPENSGVVSQKSRESLAATYYVVLPVLHNPKIACLIIPCWELLRFYFGVSGRLISAIIKGNLEDYVSWELSNIEGSTLTLSAHIPLSNKEAATLGRAVKEESEARRQLLGIHQHLAATRAANATRSAANQHPLNIRMTMPFTTETELVVTGKEIVLVEALKSSDTPICGVFVSEIVHCSQLFPFSRVILEIDGKFTKASDSDESLSINRPGKIQPRLFDLDEDPLEINDRPADANLKRIVTIQKGRHFGGFDNIQFERRRVDMAVRDGQHISKDQDADTTITGLTLGDGTYSSDGKGNAGITDFQSRDNAPIPRDIAQFLDVLTPLSELLQPYKWSIAPPAWTKDDAILSKGYRVPFPDVFGKRKTWHKISEPPHVSRPREIAIVEIKRANSCEHFYLMEMELRSDELSGQSTILVFNKNGLSRLGGQQLRRLLRLTAERRRWPDERSTWEKQDIKAMADKFFSDMQTHRIIHPKSTEGKGDNKVPKKTSEAQKEWSEKLFGEILCALGAKTGEFSAHTA